MNIATTNRTRRIMTPCDQGWGLYGRRMWKRNRGIFQKKYSGRMGNGRGGAGPPQPRWEPIFQGVAWGGVRLDDRARPSHRGRSCADLPRARTRIEDSIDSDLAYLPL